MPTAQGRRTFTRAARVVLPLLVVVAAVVEVQVWHGPTVLTLSAAHGLDTGDLIAVPFLLAAIAAARQHVPPRAGGWALRASAVTLGALLLVAGMLAGEGGPLVPAGGATLDGAITQTMAKHDVPVGEWTHVALTYDGRRERLYVDGDEVAEHKAVGRVQTPATPLWIGSNEPYEEHFAGDIDDVRVYARAQTITELRADMRVGVKPERGLIAGYPFDAGTRSTADDVSGEHNAGRIERATWVPGRYGRALRFDGEQSVVRVPSSASLAAPRAFTLSAWVRPTSVQSDWRAIVQRQVDAYFLAASSGRVSRHGLIDDVRFIPLLAAAIWFAFLVATVRAPRTSRRRRTWWLPVILFALGSLADAISAPAVTVIGPLLVAAWLAATATARVEAAGLCVTATACAALSAASLVDLDGLGDTLARVHGSTARSAALGVLFVLAGLAARSSRSPKWDERRMSIGGEVSPPRGVEHPSNRQTPGYEPPDRRS
jgi:hypothetical protein